MNTLPASPLSSDALPSALSRRAMLSLMLAAAWGPARAAETLTGAGSSAAAPLYRAWATAYGKTQDVQLQYEASGSSAGLKKIRAQEVAFGASDVAPPEAELNRDQLVLVPTFVTGAVPVVNLPRIPRGRLRLTGEVLAQIYLGSITRWSAPEIAALNPDLSLPDLAIRPVGRSDGSGTTWYVADYLSRISPTWKERLGTKTSLAWGEHVTGAKGSDGVVRAVQETPGAIGYVDFNYVGANGLSPVQLRNVAGEFATAGVPGFKAALRASDWALKANFHASLANLPGPGVWPITMGTFVLMPRVSDKPTETARALRFLMWALLKGDSVVEGLSFVRLPDALQASAFRALSSVVDRQGRKLGAEAFSAVAQAG